MQDNPYAAPNFSNRAIHGEHYVAKLQFLCVYSIAVIATLVTAAPILWIASYWDLVEWPIILPAMGIAFMLQAIIIRWQSVIVSPDLIRCADFWGRHYTIGIDSIQSVEPIGLPPFRFLKLMHSEESPPLWLPLFIQRPQEFWAYAQRELPCSNPLHAWAAQQHVSATSQQADT